MFTSIFVVVETGVVVFIDFFFVFVFVLFFFFFAFVFFSPNFSVKFCKVRRALYHKEYNENESLFILRVESNLLRPLHLY